MELVKSIEVFKDVEITNDYAAGKSRFGEQDCLNITSVHGDFKDGFVNAVFAFSMEQDCCEDFGTEFSEGLYGEHYVTRIHIYEDVEDSNDGAYGSMKVVIDVLEPLNENTRTNKQKQYTWKCYNDHNGYYGHSINVEVSEGGQKAFEYSNIY